MLRIQPHGLAIVLSLSALFVAMGCGGNGEQHRHSEGENGGFIVTLGRDHLHAEILFADGKMTLFLLGEDETSVVETGRQEIEVFLRPFGDARARSVLLKPDPQIGDGDDQCSRFSGALPDDLPAMRLQVTVPAIVIKENRYRFSFTTSEPLMPAKVSDEAERELYLTPGGAYTSSDIEANGSETASQKFVGFISHHDMKPPVGSKICPITSTAANPECTWIIGGQEYEFCCPPCIDEFVRRAKMQPESILSPDEYVKE